MVLVLAAPVAGQDRAGVPVVAPLPGTPAPPAVRREIQAVLDDAIRRFDAGDAAGVLTHVSEHYRTGVLTKPLLAEQLRALYAVNDRVRARVRIDDVRLVGEHAWVYSTGEVSGSVRVVGGSVPILWWEKELEILRREAGRWRLYGYQR